jgi:transketolase
VVSTKETPFDLDEALVLREGADVTIIACGPMVYQALMAAEQLSSEGIEAEVVNCAVIKPLDKRTILASVRKTRLVVTAEEAQAAAGLGGAIAELLGDHEPLPLLRVGMQDRFGESGKPAELMEHFHLTAPYIAEHARKLVGMKARPRTGSPVAAKR